MTERRLARSTKALRIVNITRVVADLNRSQSFYCEALGFEIVARDGVDPRLLKTLGLNSNPAEQMTLRLGHEQIVLVQFSHAGQPYPNDSRNDDLWFQHFAIVVNDMDLAYARLVSCLGWKPITTDGPQLLPPSNGSVKAFKFRDPDGHPIELLWFPPNAPKSRWNLACNALFKGIDHTAISVSSTLASVSFYTNLGFKITAQSFNHGVAQARLDGMAEPSLNVTSLRQCCADDGPGIELLEYHPPGRPSFITRPDDIATDWITAGSQRPENSYSTQRDPDGHLIVLLA